jgi:hypothetical protein
MKTSISLRSASFVFALACASVVTSFDATSAVRLMDYHYPAQVGATWLYQGRDWSGFAAHTRVTMANSAYGLTMYRGRSPAVPYTETAVQFRVESGHYSSNTFASDSIYEDWFEYFGTSGAVKALGLDEVTGQMRYDGGWSYPETIDVGATASANVDVYENGVFLGVGSGTVAALDTLPVTVPAGTFTDCVHLRITTLEGTSTRVSEEWWARGVGVVKVQGVSGDGANRLRELVSTDLMPTFLEYPQGGAVQPGQSVTFTSVASFGAPLSYQWKRNGVAIPGETSTSFTLPCAQSWQEGLYTAAISCGPLSWEIGGASLAVMAPPTSASRLLNLSTRALCLTGNDIIIPGFVISGSGTKRLLMRAIGPELAQFGIANLPDPQITLKRWNGSAYVEQASNDNWGSNANVAEIISAANAVYAFPLAGGSFSSALLLDLAPGQYTLVTSDTGTRTGVSTVELYDIDAAASGTRLINISNRGYVGAGNDVMIPGFVVSEEGPKTFLIRAVGPTLASYGVTGVLVDPQLRIYRRLVGSSIDESILTNDNWGENGDAATTGAVAAQVYAQPLPSGSKDAAFVVTLTPAIYTVHASGVGGTSGVALVEVYVVQ